MQADACQQVNAERVVVSLDVGVWRAHYREAESCTHKHLLSGRWQFLMHFHIDS
jgi:hypothetical protein